MIPLSRAECKDFAVTNNYQNIQIGICLTKLVGENIHFRDFLQNENTQFFYSFSMVFTNLKKTIEFCEGDMRVCIKSKNSESNLSYKYNIIILLNMFKFW